MSNITIKYDDYKCIVSFGQFGASAGSKGTTFNRSFIATVGIGLDDEHVIVMLKDNSKFYVRTSTSTQDEFSMIIDSIQYMEETPTIPTSMEHLKQMIEDIIR